MSFTDTADQPRSPVEIALREAQTAERAARTEAEAQRQRLHQLLLELPAIMATYRGSDHVYDLVSPPFQQLFPARLLPGRPIREALPELAGQGLYELLDRVYQTGEPFYGQEVPTRVDYTNTGQLEQRYHNMYFQATRDVQGAVDGLLSFAYDVTEQVLARQQLQRLNQELEARVQERTRAALALQADLLAAAQQQADQRALFYQVFEETPAAICIQRGPDHRYEYVNAAYQAFFPDRQLLGRPVAEALPETVGGGVVNLLDHVYQTGETYFGEELPLLMAQPHGQPPKQMYFTFTYQAIRENGAIVGISTFAYDVAEQVAARQLLEQREASFRILADAAPAMLWVTDPDGQCTYLNAQWYRFTGQTEAEALGMGWTHAVHPDDAAMAGELFLDANARRVPFHCRYRLRRQDGVYRWATDTGLPRFTETGAYAGIVGTVIDIHEQHLAEDELQASNAQLTRSNVDLDNFIYTASHDLKAPISNIEGLLYLLQEELPQEVAQNEDVGPTLTRMFDAVERFKRTIDHLTEVSKLQKEHTPATTRVDLAAVVEGVRQDLRPLIEAAGAKLFVDVAALPPVQFTEKNLRSIVYNLLSNALKYRHPDRTPHVDVRAHVRAGHTVLEVHDNGLGLAEYQLPRLFGMFQRFHDHVEGTGIGLYMVKRMVDNAGGRIEVHSQLGAGTTFFVFLPHTTSTDGTPFPAFLRS